MPSSVAIRLAVEGGAEVKRVFDDAGRAGQQAFQGVSAAADVAGASVDRQTARYQRLAEAARQAEAQSRAQANVNALLGVGTGSGASARDSASVFELQARAAEEATRRAEALSREVATLQSRFDPMAAAGARYSAALADIARAEDVGAISAARAAAARLAAVRSFEDSTQRLERAGLAQKASAQALVNGQLIVPNRGADVAAYGEGLDRLRAKYSPLFAAQREYLGQLAEIRQAVRNGALTQAEGARAVQSTKDIFARQVTDLRAKGAGRLTGSQAQNLLYQGTDIIASAASGMSPMTILLQQGGQIAQTFAGPGGASVKGAITQATEAATGFAARIGVVGGVIGVSTVALFAGAAALLSYQARLREVDRLLSGVGRASGASAQQVNAAAVAIAASGDVSAREARTIAATFASTGRIGADLFVQLGRSAKDFAATTGQEVPDATKELAQAFADPAKGAQTLNDRLGFLNASTERTIRNLQEQGDRTGAQRVLFEAYAASLSRAADLTTALGDKTSAFGRIFSNVFDWLGERVSDAFGGATVDRQLELLEERLRAIAAARSGVYGYLPGSGSAFASEAQDVQARINQLRQQQATQDQQRQRAQAAQNNRDVMGLVDQLNPAAREVDQLRNRVELLRKAISDRVTFGFDPQQMGQVQAAFERLQNLARSAREDIERYGSTSAATALRAAQNANQNVGLNPVNRALTERQQQLERDLRDKNLNNLTSREEINRQINERAGNDNLDAQDRASLERERAARLANIAEREALIETSRIDTDRIRKDAEEVAKRSGSATTQLFAQAMIGAESGGSLTVKNPVSSATGLGQFIAKTWLELFTQTFPERASGMNRDQILAQRTNRDDQLALIDVYSRQNARKLETAGFETSLRNQYAMWVAGPTGGMNLLKADPSAPVSGILDPEQISKNQRLFGGGKNAGQALDALDEAINRRLPNSRATERQTDILRSTITLTDQVAEAEARRQKIQDLLNEAVERGSEVGRQFTTAQELEAASGDKLSDTVRTQRKVILDLADSYAKASAEQEKSKLFKDAMFERSQIGRTSDEQQIASRLRGTGESLTGASAEALRLNQTLSQTKDISKEAFTGFVSDIMRGTSALGALQNMLSRVADKLLNSFADRAFSGILSGFTGGGLPTMAQGGIGPDLPGASSGGFMGAIRSLLPFDRGGYTGPGNRLEVAGLVHRGEVVWSQDDVRRAGGASIVEALRIGSRGYAEGGYVRALDDRDRGYLVPAAVARSAGRQAGQGGVPSVQVNVHNAPADHTATATVTQTPQGPSIDVQLEKVVGGMIADGRFDGLLRRRFGMRATG
ncbi:phage tail length tape measure family protein [Methylobacterium sp. WSM2598]|uniref:phage tail length tape measure family protein n=1 Tax=Methylobacterium sp. WSM2598 TaxID=398261 RepID=UPI000378AF64|nr:phage tail length tape measure family protein [Methylobacterium sp. WSM2598]